MENIGIVLFILMVIAHLFYVYTHKPKIIGTIIICKKDNTLIIELKNEEAMDELMSNRAVTFDVHIER